MGGSERRSSYLPSIDEDVSSEGSLIMVTREAASNRLATFTWLELTASTGLDCPD